MTETLDDALRAIEMELKELDERGRQGNALEVVSEGSGLRVRRWEVDGLSGWSEPALRGTTLMKTRRGLMR